MYYIDESSFLKVDIDDILAQLDVRLDTFKQERTVCAIHKVSDGLFVTSNSGEITYLPNNEIVLIQSNEHPDGEILPIKAKDLETGDILWAK